MDLDLSFNPETLKLGQIWRFFAFCALEILWMTLKNNRAHLLSNIKLCASFHHHIWIQTGVTVRKWGWQAGSTVSSVCAPEVYGLFYLCIPSTYSSFVQQLYEGVKTTDLRSSVDLLPVLMNNLWNYVELSYKSLSVQCIREFRWELVAMTTSSYQAGLLITLSDLITSAGEVSCSARCWHAVSITQGCAED